MSSTQKILIFSALLLFALGCYFTPYLTLGITLGASWGTVNIFFLKQVLQNLLIKAENKNVKLLVFTLIKFPFLYLAGFGLLSIKKLSAVDLLIGFTLALLGALVNYSLNFQRRGAAK